MFTPSFSQLFPKLDWHTEERRTTSEQEKRRRHRRDPFANCCLMQCLLWPLLSLSRAEAGGGAKVILCQENRRRKKGRVAFYPYSSLYSYSTLHMGTNHARLLVHVASLSGWRECAHNTLWLLHRDRKRTNKILCTRCIRTSTACNSLRLRGPVLYHDEEGGQDGARTQRFLSLLSRVFGATPECCSNHFLSLSKVRNRLSTSHSSQARTFQWEMLQDAANAPCRTALACFLLAQFLYYRHPPL